MNKEEVIKRVEELLEEDRENKNNEMNEELAKLLETLSEDELPEEMTVRQYRKYIRKDMAKAEEELKRFMEEDPRTNPDAIAVDNEHEKLKAFVKRALN